MNKSRISINMLDSGIKYMKLRIRILNHGGCAAVQTYKGVQPAKYTKNINNICFRIRISRFVNGIFPLEAIALSTGLIRRVEL